MAYRQALDDVSDNGAEPGGLPIAHPVTVRLSDVTPERVTWLWPGRLPLGKLVVVEGDPGDGKSTLLLDLAARVSTGSPMPDGQLIDGPSGVVVMSAEDGLADTIRPRLDAAGADPSRVVALTEIRTEEEVVRPPSLPADVPELERVIVAEDARLVIVDVLNAYLSSGIDSYKDQDVRRAMHPLASLAERTGACIVVVRHLTKGAGAKAMYRGSGSIGIVGAVRVGLLVARHPEDEATRVLAVAKSNLAKIPDALAYRLVEDELRGVARVKWDGPVPFTADALVAPPQQDDDDTPDAVAALVAVLGDGPRWVKDVLDAMAEAGFSKDQAKRAKAKARARSVKVGKPGDPEQGWKWELPTPRRAHEEGEGRGVPDPTPFAPFDADALPSEPGEVPA